MCPRGSVLGSWVGVRRPFHLFLFLFASRMVLPKILVLTYLVVEPRILELMQQAAQAAKVRGRVRCGRGLRDGGVVFALCHSRVEAVGILELLRGRQQARAVCEGMVASVPGTWGKAMRGAVRNRGRWIRRRAPTQDPSTDRSGG